MMRFKNEKNSDQKADTKSDANESKNVIGDDDEEMAKLNAASPPSKPL
jgi:hypothetical protein